LWILFLKRQERGVVIKKKIESAKEGIYVYLSFDLGLVSFSDPRYTHQRLLPDL
jgi:hypothetical protein